MLILRKSTFLHSFPLSILDPCFRFRRIVFPISVLICPLHLFSILFSSILLSPLPPLIFPKKTKASYEVGFTQFSHMEGITKIGIQDQTSFTALNFLRSNLKNVEKENLSILNLEIVHDLFTRKYDLIRIAINSTVQFLRISKSIDYYLHLHF